jgi:hypothetical protein
VVLETHDGGIDADRALDALRQDSVILARDLNLDQAERAVEAIAAKLSLIEQLELQAGFASFLGHRKKIGKYFMSVNNRNDYQFFAPHSEGDSFSNMQLASFYCIENSTDGGDTILLNVDSSSGTFPELREKLTRIAPGSKPLTPGEMARVKAQYKLASPPDIRNDDQVLQERPTQIPGLTIADVLAKPIKTYSRILDRDLFVYWDSVASIDYESLRMFANLLRGCGLLKEPDGGLDVGIMDNAAKRRVWTSGADHASVFRCKAILKLVPGDLIVQNNLTWTHSASNWTPGSGVRNLAAAFA